MTTPPSSSGHWPELEGQIPLQQPHTPPPTRPQADFAATLQDFGTRVGAGARDVGKQAQAKFKRTRERIDTPENRARLTRSGQQARSSLRTLPVPTIVYGVTAALIFLLAWFPWFVVSMTHRASVNMGFWGSSVGESAITGPFNGFGIGAMVGGMRATGSRDSYTEESMIHGLLLLATLLTVTGLIVAAVMVRRGAGRIGHIVAAATGAVYAVFLMSNLGGRIWQGSIAAADSEAIRGANPMAVLSSSATTSDVPVVHLVILAALIVAGVGAWHVWQARRR